LKNNLILITISLFTTFFVQAQSVAPSVSVKDVYHGVAIIDEYRNLENLQDTNVVNWMKSQTSYTNAVIKSISNRALFLDRVKLLNSKTKFYYGNPRITINGSYFYSKIQNDGAYTKLYHRAGLYGKETLLYDPKNFKPKSNTPFIISYYSVSPDGSKIAIALTEGGKEISEIIVVDVKTKKVLPEVITNTWPSDFGGINWLADNSGFVYVHIPNIDSKSEDFIKNTQAVVYKLGDKAGVFRVIFSMLNNPEVNMDKADFPIVSTASRHNQYFFSYVGGAQSYNDYYYAQIKDVYSEKISWKPLFKKEDKIDLFKVYGHDLIYAKQKNNESALYKTSLLSANFTSEKAFITLSKDEIVSDLNITKEGLFFSTIKNGIVAKLYFYNNITVKEISLPATSGSVSIQNIDIDRSDIWITCSGWTKRDTRYKYNVKTNIFTPEEIGEKVNYPEFNDIITEEVTIKTHDGLDLPLTIIYKKGLKKNGKNRTIMNGYGCYGYSNSPYFIPYALFWVNDGGIIVQTHERGGGEKGNLWHEGGYKKTKPNTWKDFISSAEYLIKAGYTSTEHLGIQSASAGGILIGRAITERPDLFKAAVIEVGTLNVLRSEITPNGPNNVKEFGTVTDKDEFTYLLEMDAFHHIKKGIKYPATLITAGMNDPRVIAWMPAKFAAKLQANNSSNNPILLNVDIDAGHGGDVSFDKQYESMADTYAFFYWQLGHPDYKLVKK
jgi:prolyl oligopeptidase